MPTRAGVPGIFASTDYPSYSHYNSYPGGLMCFIERTTATGNFSTEATLSGFDTGDLTLLDNRLYRVRFELAVQDDGIDSMRFWLTDRDNNHLCYADAVTDASILETTNIQVGKVGTFFLHAPGAGTYGYKVRAEVLEAYFGLGGTPFSACDVTGGSGLIGYIMVEDVGPAF